MIQPHQTVPQVDRLCMSAAGDVYIGTPRTGAPDVHDLIVAGELEKALSVVSKGTGDRVLDGVRGDNLPLKVPIPTPLLKSRTWSGHPIRKRLTLHGMKISIENPAGSYRTGTDNDGKPWRSLLHFDYGYIRGTIGFDKDHVDCFLGPNLRDSQSIFIIHQKDVKTGKYDEDKIMLGWLTQGEAVRDYLKNYNRRDMYQGCTKMGIDEFKLKCPRTNDKPRKITSVIPLRAGGPKMMIKAHVKAHPRRLQSGKVVQVRAHVDTRTKKTQEQKSRRFKGITLVKVGAVPTGPIKIPGRDISGASDIAAIFKGMKDDAREKYWVVGTKRGGRIVSVELHSMGGLGDSSIDIRVVVSVLRDNGAEEYWGIHNHPSGQSQPSRDDLGITSKIRKLAAKVGIKQQSDIIIHGGKDTYTVFSRYAEKTLVAQEQDKGGVNWKEFPITELKVTGRKKAPKGMLSDISGPASVAALGKWIQSKHGDGIWGITLNVANQIQGYFLLGDNHLDDVGTRSRYVDTLLKHMMDTGAGKCITVGTNTKIEDMKAYQKNLEFQLSDTRYETLDAVFENKGAYYSVSEGRHYMAKAHVKAHTRLTRSGKVVSVREHEDSRTVHQEMHQRSVEAEGKYQDWLRTQPEALKEADQLVARHKGAAGAPTKAPKMKPGELPGHDYAVKRQLAAHGKRAVAAREEDRRKFQSKWTSLYARRDTTKGAAPYVKFAKIGLARNTRKETFEGVAYEFWVGETGYGIRVEDNDSGNVIHLISYPIKLKAKAEKSYTETVEAARKAAQ